MDRRGKRIWTLEQKEAARQRMIARRDAQATPVAVKERTPEVQAVLESMTPERRAKLASIQAANLATLSQTREGREALERLEARHSPTEERVTVNVEVPRPFVVPEAIIPSEPPRVIVREIPMKAPFRLTGSQSGLMISELGSCRCGEARLKWHPICVMVRV